MVTLYQLFVMCANCAFNSGRNVCNSAYHRYGPNDSAVRYDLVTDWLAVWGQVGPRSLRSKQELLLAETKLQEVDK